ncbi:MAG: Bacterial regulatory protein luxR family [Pseudomonadota bacterium]|jgi:DNA-binding CsgD family transcriptional regulator
MKNKSRANYDAPYPQNLTPTERKAVEAIRDHGEDKRAAQAMGISVSTLRTHTRQARSKAGVSSTVRMVVLYMQAECQRQGLQSQ